MESFTTKTTEDIYTLFKELQHQQKTQEANRLRTAYVLYHATESIEVNYLNHAFSMLLAEESTFADLLQSLKKSTKPDGRPLVAWSKDELSGIQAFLKAKIYLANGNTNGILVADLFRNDELKYWEANEEETLNSAVLFNVYCGIREEWITTKYAEHLERTYPFMHGTSKSFTSGKEKVFAEHLKAHLVEWSELTDSEEKERERIPLKGFLLCFAAFYQFKKNYADAEDFLNKALTLTNKGEYEYNLIRFLQKELRIETAQVQATD